MSGMRTLIVTRSTPAHPGFGGMERVTWDIARGLAKRGGDITVLTTPVPGRPVGWLEEGVRVVTVPGVRSGRYSPKWWLKTALYRSAKTYDSVISASAAATAMIHLQRGPKYVFHAHGTAKRELVNVVKLRPAKWPLKALRYAYWMMLDCLTYARVNTVAVASETVAAALRELPYRGLWKRTRLELVENGVDFDHFDSDEINRAAQRMRFGFAPGDYVIATISRLDRQKGADQVVEALPMTPENVHLIIGGSGVEEANLRAQVERLGLTHRVTFTGHLDYDGVRDVLHPADEFVLPVRNFDREALPLSVLEATAAGLRSIVPVGSTWPAEIERAVRFVDVSDPAALAQALSDRVEPHA